MTGSPELQAALFQALSHPIRVRILELLGEKERSVGELTACLAIDSSSISQHLSALRQQALVFGRKRGTSVLYSLRDDRSRQLLVLARALLTTKLKDNQNILDELLAEQPTRSEL